MITKDLYKVVVNVIRMAVLLNYSIMNRDELILNNGIKIGFIFGIVYTIISLLLLSCVYDFLTFLCD